MALVPPSPCSCHTSPACPCPAQHRPESSPRSLNYVRFSKCRTVSLRHISNAERAASTSQLAYSVFSSRTVGYWFKLRFHCSLLLERLLPVTPAASSRLHPGTGHWCVAGGEARGERTDGDLKNLQVLSRTRRLRRSVLNAQCSHAPRALRRRRPGDWRLAASLDSASISIDWGMRQDERPSAHVRRRTYYVLVRYWRACMAHDAGCGMQAIGIRERATLVSGDRKSTRLNSSHSGESRMPSSA